MKVLIQRVSEACVRVDDEMMGEIRRGLLLLVGVCAEDTLHDVKRLTKKVLGYRVFSDDQGRMNLSVSDIEGQLLVVSQFTLSASTRKGLRPSFSSSAEPERAAGLFDAFVKELKASGLKVETGIFAADMQVSLINDGPVTFLLE